MLARKPKQFDLGELQRPTRRELGNFPLAAACEEENLFGNGK